MFHVLILNFSKHISPRRLKINYHERIIIFIILNFTSLKQKTYKNITLIISEGLLITKKVCQRLAIQKLQLLMILKISFSILLVSISYPNISGLCGRSRSQVQNFGSSRPDHRLPQQPQHPQLQQPRASHLSPQASQRSKSSSPESQPEPESDHPESNRPTNLVAQFTQTKQAEALAGAERVQKSREKC